MVGDNEAKRCEYIISILYSAIRITRNITNQKITLNTGHVDYVIKNVEELLCITEGKQEAIQAGFAQNLVQLESSYKVNKKKCTIDETFGDYDYLYGIVSTATEWYFILYSTNGIACTSRSPYNIRFIEAALVKNSKEEKELHENVKKIVEIIVGLLKDRVEVENISAKKKSRIDQILSQQ